MNHSFIFESEGSFNLSIFGRFFVLLLVPFLHYFEIVVLKYLLLFFESLSNHFIFVQAYFNLVSDFEQFSHVGLIKCAQVEPLLSKVVVRFRHNMRRYLLSGLCLAFATIWCRLDIFSRKFLNLHRRHFLKTVFYNYESELK